MAKVFGINTKIRGKVGEYIYRQTKVGTVVSEAPVKPITPLRTQSQMNTRTQWANLGAIYKQFDSMLRRGFEELPRRGGCSQLRQICNLTQNNIRICNHERSKDL